jgi:hypothetical protein
MNECPECLGSNLNEGWCSCHGLFYKCLWCGREYLEDGSYIHHFFCIIDEEKEQ